VAIFPSPDPTKAGGGVFRAPRVWEFNVCGAAVVAVGAAMFFLAVGGIEIWVNRGLRWSALLLLLNAAVGVLLILPPGNLVAMFPYAAEVEEGKGVHFYAPFNKLYIPLEELTQVEWSYPRTGWVVKLKRRHGLVGRLVIHGAWGPRGRDLAGAIEHQLGRPAG